MKEEIIRKLLDFFSFRAKSFEEEQKIYIHMYLTSSFTGASSVYVVDSVPERLSAAKKIGCIPIDFTKVDAVAEIIKLNKGMIDRSVDAVGYQASSAKDPKKEVPSIVLEVRYHLPCPLYLTTLPYSTLNSNSR